ncbi:hypothetical protein FDUTEX481_08072 [Tolypothrix sp. PCC 7601]|nr:hypothetical protein FDUTEX481_08072 [Tolypothrix sp. PCC 7601]
MSIEAQSPRNLIITGDRNFIVTKTVTAIKSPGVPDYSRYYHFKKECDR